jgi:hypothetical protein
MSGSKTNVTVVTPGSHTGEKRKSDRLGLAVLTVLLCGVCAGCRSDFDETKMRLTTEKNQVHLDSEQVTVTQGQVDCGVSRELFDPPEVVSKDRSVARLRQAARDLGFSDDISIDEPGYPFPYAQMRGDFMLRVDELIDTKDGPGEGVKTVVAKVRVKVPHECFGGDLPIMGIRRGQFVQGQPTTLIFQMENGGWHLDHFVH